MRTLKEDFFDNLGIGEKSQIEYWLRKYKINNFKINDDLTIDVKYLDLSCYKEESLPEFIQFGKVIMCDVSNSNLKTLKGLPQDYVVYFYCNYCEELTSLQYCPKRVSNFECEGCSKLKSLKFGPSIVNGTFKCRNCGKKFKVEDVIKICPKINLEYVIL